MRAGGGSGEASATTMCCACSSFTGWFVFREGLVAFISVEVQVLVICWGSSSGRGDFVNASYTVSRFPEVFRLLFPLCGTLGGRDKVLCTRMTREYNHQKAVGCMMEDEDDKTLWMGQRCNCFQEGNFGL